MISNDELISQKAFANGLSVAAAMISDWMDGKGSESLMLLSGQRAALELRTLLLRNAQIALPFKPQKPLEVRTLLEEWYEQLATARREGMVEGLRNAHEIAGKHFTAGYTVEMLPPTKAETHLYMAHGEIELLLNKAIADAKAGEVGK